MAQAPSRTSPDGQACVLARDLMVELTGAVPTMGGHQVIVGFGGTEAFCDPALSYVNIPALPETTDIPIQVARQIRGFAGHEAAHLAFTDPSVPIVRRDGTRDALQHSLWNCVEDYMIERFWLELYPGALKNFAATETWCCDRYLANHATHPGSVYDLRQVGGVALTWMRALYFGLGTTRSRDCLDTLPADHRTRVEGWFRTLVVPVETTQEALHAAWAIYDDIMANPLSAQTPAHVRKALGAPAQKSPGAAPKGSPAGAAGTPGTPAAPGPSTGGTSAGMATPQAGTPPASTPPMGPQGTGAGTFQAGGSGPGAAHGAPIPAADLKPVTPLPTGFDLGAALKGAQIAPSAQPLCAPVISTSTTGIARTPLSHPQGRAKAEASVGGMGEAIARTSAELRRSLKTVSKDRWRSGRLDGIVDSKRMAFAATGSLEYHRKLVRGEAIDTAVSILIDCSSSMKGTRISICQQVAVMLERALMGTPIAHEILGYTTADPQHADPALLVAQQAHKARGQALPIQATSLYVFRPFGARHPEAMTSLGGMTDVPMGGTPTSQGMYLAHDRLCRRPERRHVLMVLTDGDSDNSARTRAAGAAIARCGVSVLGIGINTTAVAREFAHHATVAQASQLPDLMVSTLSDILLGDKRKRGFSRHQVARMRTP